MSDFFCEFCSTCFSKHFNLRSHAKKFHPDSVDDIAPNKSKSYNFQCDRCGRGFIHLHHLRQHQKNTHNLESPKKTEKCLMCNCETTKSELLKHFGSAHGITIQSETKEFQTLVDFNSWKLETEKETNSSFIKTQGSYKTKNYTRAKYVCHRSGSYQAKGNGLRHLKTQGSNKINAFCPAVMIVTCKNELCHVEFTKTHVGHGEDLGHLTLSEGERKMLASKIAAKVPFHCILDDVRDSVTDCNVERIHLLTKKDLYNIEQSYRLNETSVRHKNDAISVESWVKEMDSSGCVLLYKPQDVTVEEYPDLKKEYFLLIIMNSGQLEMLQKYGSDCICLDGTHGLNGYGFELNTLLVLNEVRQGFPCSFLISNRSDQQIMHIFFSCIKDKLKYKIKPKVFMSDIFYNALLQVMDPAEFRLYCTWHVDRAWRKNLNKINSKEKQVIVYKQLRTILQEIDVNAFTLMLQEFLNSLFLDIETIELASYFLNNYEKKVFSWAYCYRINSGLNTNMHLENMHRAIKYLYLDGKHTKRLDKAINAILKFVRDKLFDQLITSNKGKLCSKIKELRKRHIVSQGLNLSSVKVTETGFEVFSSSNQIYNVEERVTDCKCKLVCTDCEACLHRFSCTCVDYCIKWNMCKHIHLVLRYKKYNFKTPDTIGSELEPTSADVENNFLVQEVTANNMEKIIEAVSKPKQLDTLEVLKENLKQSFLEALEKIESHEKYDAMRKIMAPLHPTLDALENGPVVAQNFLQNVPETTYNKKILPQRRLFSTKKRKSKQAHNSNQAER